MKKVNGKEQLEGDIRLALDVLVDSGSDGILAACRISSGTAPIQKKSKCDAIKCRECGTVQGYGSKCKKCGQSFYAGNVYREVRAGKTWTECYKIEIKKVKSKAEYKEVEK